MKWGKTAGPRLPRRGENSTITKGNLDYNWICRIR